MNRTITKVWFDKALIRNVGELRARVCRFDSPLGQDSIHKGDLTSIKMMLYSFPSLRLLFLGRLLAHFPLDAEY